MKTFFCLFLMLFSLNNYAQEILASCSFKGRTDEGIQKFEVSVKKHRDAAIITLDGHSLPATGLTVSQPEVISEIASYVGGLSTVSDLRQVKEMEVYQVVSDFSNFRLFVFKAYNGTNLSQIVLNNSSAGECL